jgi:vancomycin permeability regulator SanA
MRQQIARLARFVAEAALAGALAVSGANIWVGVAARGRAFSAVEAVPARAIAIVPGTPTSRKQVNAALLGRLQGALELYRAGRVRAILVSGIETEKDPETSAMRRWLEDRGIPSRDIMSDARGTRTRATMARATQVFGVENAVVCTERMHMARALFLARQSGIDAVGLELESPMSRVPKWVLREALKTTLAVVEEGFAPTTSGHAASRAIALR